MPEQKERQNQEYAVYLLGGKVILIYAHRIVINHGENRIYFITADNQSVDDWVIFISGVAAIHNANGKIQFGGIND